MAARDGPFEAQLGPVSHSWLNPSIGWVQHSAYCTVFTLSLHISSAIGDASSSQWDDWNHLLTECWWNSHLLMETLHRSRWCSFFSVFLFEHFSRFVGGCPSQRPNECWQTVRVSGRDQRFFRGQQSGSVGTARSASEGYWCDQFARLKAAVHGPSLEPLECIIFVCVAETKNGTRAFYLLCCSRIQLMMTPHLAGPQGSAHLKFHF